MRVFISAPFFSKDQINKVKAVEKALAANPTVDSYYSPRLHQSGGGYKEFTYNWSKITYQNDLKGVRDADVTIEILDFDKDDADSGTAYEFGYAKAIGKFTTSISFDDYPTNLMLGIGSDHHFKGADEVRNYDFHLKLRNKFTHRMH